MMELYIGKPAQLVYGIFDTGSDIIWLQCEGRVGQLGTVVTYYNQSKSSSYKVINCKDKINCQTKRGDMGCRRDDPSNNCNFEAEYISGQIAKGVMSSDVTTLKPLWEEYQDFVFGCSNDNAIELPGIIGASNSFFSIPKQLFPDDPKFSYCIPNDLTKTSLIKFGDDANLAGNPIKVLRHRKKHYYYLDVYGIQINREDISVDPSVFKMDPNGDGYSGFVIDSGSTATVLPSYRLWPSTR
ncbi:hypothetical protein RND81_02G213100 [Saponaria officinalis]|uniref:Peptidase A1 domain-containing protein n=1 Tax=Saponaria officinalis TaxID=3572 RepID=A0AAW1MXW6_SAPOF